jgi:hypothetical protein
MNGTAVLNPTRRASEMYPSSGRFKTHSAGNVSGVGGGLLFLIQDGSSWWEISSVLRCKVGGRNGSKRASRHGHVAARNGAGYTYIGCCVAEGGKYLKMKFISLSCLFAIATLASPELTISKAYANTFFDGSWSVQITMDRGNCDPINRLAVDIRDGAMQYTGDSAVSIQGQVLNGGDVRVRLTRGDHKVNGGGRLLASSGTGTWHGTGLASSCAGRWSAERH